MPAIGPRPVKDHHLAFFVRPSDAQIAAGNYRKPKVKIQGLPISIENQRGSIREGRDPDGKPWATGMLHHYGYIRRTEGTDGDQVDVYLGPLPSAPMVYLITTNHAPEFTEPDEQKVMLGFPTEEAARDAFHQHYDDPRFFRELVAMPMAEFKRKVFKADGELIKGLTVAGTSRLAMLSDAIRYRPAWMPLHRVREIAGAMGVDGEAEQSRWCHAHATTGLGDVLTRLDPTGERTQRAVASVFAKQLGRD